MKVFYRPEQSCDVSCGYSPSAGKPAKVISDWLNHKLITRDDVLPFKPLALAQIQAAHDPAYVQGVMRLSEPNGFGNTSHAVADTLPYTCGSMLAAAQYAIEHKTHTCSPTSGFHHASYHSGEGFCTFNGLMTTVMALPDLRVGILDCDRHWGDGTFDITTRLQLDGLVSHYSFGLTFGARASCGDGGLDFLKWLETAVERLQDCDLILYQAGADPHVSDPLGGLLSTKMMRVRDCTVFQGFRGKPLVWNLAGGYQRDKAGTIAPVLKLHRTTAQMCIKNLENV